MGGQRRRMSADEEVGRLFRVRKTVTKMLHDRGYVISNEELNKSLVSFKEQYGSNPTREQMTMMHRHSDDHSSKLFVFFQEEDNVGVKPVRKCLEKMKEQSVNKAIIIVRGKLTPFAKQALQNTNTSHGYRWSNSLKKSCSLTSQNTCLCHLISASPRTKRRCCCVNTSSKKHSCQEYSSKTQYRVTMG